MKNTKVQLQQTKLLKSGNFDTSVDTIREYIADYIANTKERPTIIIDYLQILAPSNTNLTDKQQIDYNVTTLKKISRDYGIPIIAISSFNRMNYRQTASYEAFKESGGIEYTADVIFTMQLTALRNNENITNEQLNQAKQENPRKVQLVCLKNRNGKSYFEINFLYNPVFNHFITEDEWNRQHGIF